MKHFAKTFPRISAWLVFFAGLAALVFCDYYLRMRDGEIWNGGIPDMLNIGAVLLLGCMSVCLLWHVVRKRENRILGILEIAGHIIAGYVLMYVTMFCYILGTGIDSL